MDSVTDTRPHGRPWLTTAELAEHANVNLKTVYREIKRGNLGSTRAGGGRSSFVIDRAEAERWLAGYRKGEQ